MLMLVTVLLALLGGLGSGLARLGWQMDSHSQDWILIHGPLMISGFLGTLLCLERAVALESRYRWSIIVPAVNALGAIVLLGLPLVMIQFIADLRNLNRSLVAELASSLAMGAVASAIVLIDGWLLLPAFGLWLALGVKAVAAVLYVRARLRLERNMPAHSKLAVIFHIIGLILLVVAAFFAIVPWTVPAAMIILLLRAVIGLSSLRKVRPPKIIGMQEIAYGLAFVIAIAIGYSGHV